MCWGLGYFHVTWEKILKIHLQPRKLTACTFYVNTAEEEKVSSWALISGIHNLLLWREWLLGESMQMQFLFSVESSWTGFSLSSRILLCWNTIWLYCALLGGYSFITLGQGYITTLLTVIWTCWLDCLYLAFMIFVFTHSRKYHSALGTVYSVLL